ncbi:MAG: hypothetical protein NZL83_04310 [Candidatus Absconditabacterales bacterium]|nr:hypothetical protein [Candidatus Absconditabacterales bacterium]
MSVTLFHLNTDLILFLLGLMLLMVFFVGALTVILLTLYGRLDHHRRHAKHMLAHQQFSDLPPSGSTLRDQWYQYLRRIHLHWQALRVEPYGSHAHDDQHNNTELHDRPDKSTV